MSQGEAFAGTAAALRTEGALGDDIENSRKNLLEKKWTAVVRLQKKVLDLEAKLAEAAKGGGSDASIFTGAIAASQRRGIPKEPAVGSMVGHRGPVTCVCVHPIYSLAASGSEDAMVKLWDFDSKQVLTIPSAQNIPYTMKSSFTY